MDDIPHPSCRAFASSLSYPSACWLKSSSKSAQGKAAYHFIRKLSSYRPGNQPKHATHSSSFYASWSLRTAFPNKSPPSTGSILLLISSGIAYSSSFIRQSNRSSRILVFLASDKLECFLFHYTACSQQGAASFPGDPRTHGVYGLFRPAIRLR